jgi:hydrogenase nickel incorporation protein HypA/HybF
MHEYSIVQSIITTCEKHAQENEAQLITKVTVKIGVMSGVEPELLALAFDTFKEKSICDGAELILNVQNLVISCKECKKTSTLKEKRYQCPACESIDLSVIDGEEMYLMSLEME